MPLTFSRFTIPFTEVRVFYYHIDFSNPCLIQALTKYLFYCPPNYFYFLHFFVLISIQSVFSWSDLKILRGKYFAPFASNFKTLTLAQIQHQNLRASKNCQEASGRQDSRIQLEDRDEVLWPVVLPFPVGGNTDTGKTALSQVDLLHWRREWGLITENVRWCWHQVREGQRLLGVMV